MLQELNWTILIIRGIQATEILREDQAQHSNLIPEFKVQILFQGIYPTIPASTDVVFL